MKGTMQILGIIFFLLVLISIGFFSSCAKQPCYQYSNGVFIPPPVLKSTTQ